MDKLNEEDVKTLKLFSYYVQSHGCGEVNFNWDVMSGGDWDNDWSSDSCYCVDGQRIEMYEKIKNLFRKIIDENELYEKIDYDYNGQILFNIDCKERKMRVRATQEVMSTKESGDELDSESLKEDNKFEMFDKIFNEMRDAGLRYAKVYFNGSGDSGEIHDYLEGKNFNYNLDDDVNDFFYRWLENFYGGWEINEGSQGYFEFDSELKKLTLHFEENYYEQDSLGEIFYTQF